MSHFAFALAIFSKATFYFVVAKFMADRLRLWEPDPPYTEAELRDAL